MFRVTSTKSKKGKPDKIDIYTVDIRGPLCDCKSFYYRKRCDHIRSVIQMLRMKGEVVKVQKDKSHIGYGAKNGSPEAMQTLW